MNPHFHPGTNLGQIPSVMNPAMYPGNLPTPGMQPIGQQAQPMARHPMMPQYPVTGNYMQPGYRHSQPCYTPTYLPAMTGQNMRQVFATDSADRTKEQQYKDQQKKLKQFSKGVKPTADATSMIESMFGQPNPKVPTKNVSVSSGSPAVDDFGDFLSEPAVPIMTSTPAVANVTSTDHSLVKEHAQADASTRATIAIPKKDITSMMFENTDLKASNKAKSFHQKTSLKDVQLKHSKSATSFKPSMMSTDWHIASEELSTLFTIEASEVPQPQPVKTKKASPSKPFVLPTWCSDESQVPELYKHVLEACVRNGNIETNLVYPILVRSGLPREALGTIWNISNKKVPGQLVKEELFCLLALIALVQNSYQVTGLEILNRCQKAPLPFLGQTITTGSGDAGIVHSHNTGNVSPGLGSYQTVPGVTSGDHMVNIGSGFGPQAVSHSQSLPSDLGTLTPQQVIMPSMVGTQSSITTNNPPFGVQFSENIPAFTTVSNQPNDDFDDFKTADVTTVETNAISTNNSTSNDVSFDTDTTGQTFVITNSGALKKVIPISGVSKHRGMDDDFEPFQSVNVSKQKSIGDINNVLSLDKTKTTYDDLIMPDVSVMTSSLILEDELVSEVSVDNVNRINQSSNTFGSTSVGILDIPQGTVQTGNLNVISSDDFGAFQTEKIGSIENANIDSNVNIAPQQNISTDLLGVEEDKYNIFRSLVETKEPDDDFADFDSVQQPNIHIESTNTKDLAAWGQNTDTSVTNVDNDKEFGDFSAFDNINTANVSEQKGEISSQIKTSDVGKPVDISSNTSILQSEVAVSSKPESWFGDDFQKTGFLPGAKASLGDKYSSMKDEIMALSDNISDSNAFDMVVPTNKESDSGDWSNFDTTTTKTEASKSEWADFHSATSGLDTNNVLKPVEQLLNDSTLQPEKKSSKWKPKKTTGAFISMPGALDLEPPPLDELDEDDVPFDIVQASPAIADDSDLFSKPIETRYVKKGFAFGIASKATQSGEKQLNNVDKRVLKISGKESGDDLSESSLDFAGFAVKDNQSVASLDLPGIKNQSKEGSADSDSQSSYSSDFANAVESKGAPDEQSVDKLDLTSEKKEDSLSPADEDTFGDFTESTSVPKKTNSESTGWLQGPRSATEIMAQSSGPVIGDRYAAVLHDEQDSDRDIHQWKNCLSSCHKMIQEANDMLNQITSSTVCQEVVNSEKGSEYLRGVVEIYRVVCRIMTASSAISVNNTELSNTAQEIELVWNNLIAFIAGSKVMPDSTSLDYGQYVLKADKECAQEKACGVCLLNVDAKSRNDIPKLTYGGRQYHSACANFWVNCVESMLPALKLPELL